MTLFLCFLICVLTGITAYLGFALAFKSFELSELQKEYDALDGFMKCLQKKNNDFEAAIKRKNEILFKAESEIYDLKRKYVRPRNSSGRFVKVSA